MALLWLAPAWFLLDYRKTAWTFVVSGVLFGMLPDIDLVLEGIFPTVKHHGVFHTILAVTLIAAVIGPVVGKVVEAIAGGTDWLSPKRRPTASGSASWRSGSPDSPTSSRICSRRRTSPIPSNRSGRSTVGQSVSISSGTTTPSSIGAPRRRRRRQRRVVTCTPAIGHPQSERDRRRGRMRPLARARRRPRSAGLNCSRGESTKKNLRTQARIYYPLIP